MTDSDNPRRVLLKLSGEAFGGGKVGIATQVIRRIAEEIVPAVQQGVQVAIVVGGGNFIRGAELHCTGSDAASRLWMDWQRIPEIAGQLLLPLDADGRVSIDIDEYPKDDGAAGTRRKPVRRTIAYRYTPEVGWQAIRDES